MDPHLPGSHRAHLVPAGGSIQGLLAPGGLAHRVDLGGDPPSCLSHRGRGCHSRDLGWAAQLAARTAGWAARFALLGAAPRPVHRLIHSWEGMPGIVELP